MNTWFSMTFLGKKNSLRVMSEQDFEQSLDSFALSLHDHGFLYDYSDAELHNDWIALRRYSGDQDLEMDAETREIRTSSTVRAGMSICEHFFPNFFEIKNSKGVSFSDCWNDLENLKKILRWNRKSHSTPFLSELRRGVYFCCGLTKNTMYRPHMSKLICSKFARRVVLDPCCGWGGRMLGALAARKHYIGFEPNPVTYKHLKEIVHYFRNEGLDTSKCTLIHDGAENMDKYDFPEVDLILTSPPYFNLEIYHEGKQQSENNYDSYAEWRDKWLADVIQKSISRLNKNAVTFSAWNVHDVGKMKMIADVERIHNDMNFVHHRDVSLSSSKRQANQENKKKNQKNLDLTRIFRHENQGSFQPSILNLFE